MATKDNNLQQKNEDFDNLSSLLAEGLILLYKSRLTRVGANTLEKMRQLLKPEIRLFMYWLLNQNVSLVNKKNHSFNLQDCHGYDLNACQSMWSSLSLDSFKRIYKLYCTFVRKRENEGEFLKNNTTFLTITSHHIIPRFDQGTDDVDNIISCNIYIHGIFHLIRFFISGDNRDKAGVNNSLRTLEELQSMHTNRLERQREALGSRSIGRPFVPGQAPFLTGTSTGAQIAAGRRVGLAHQEKNAFKRVKSLTRFMCSLTLVFKKRGSNETCTVFLGENVGSHQVQQVGVYLSENSSFDAMPHQYHHLARLMRGVDKTRFGWYIETVALPLATAAEEIHEVKQKNQPKQIPIETAREWFHWFNWQDWKEENEWTINEEHLSDFLRDFPGSSPDFFFYVLNYRKKVHNYYNSL